MRVCAGCGRLLEDLDGLVSELRSALYELGECELVEPQRSYTLTHAHALVDEILCSLCGPRTIPDASANDGRG